MAEQQLLPSLISEHVLDDLCAHARGSPDGSFVEVGVYQGGSGQRLAMVAEEQGRAIYLFDTFEGLPHKADVDALPKGHFADTDYDFVREVIPYAAVVKGVFPNSARYIEMSYPIAFAHLDCDQYQSVKEGVEWLKPRMAQDGIIWFDDTDGLEGARQAMNECFTSDRIRVAPCGKNYVVMV